MRLPNGYGTVYKLSGKRRKPWIARKTIGWDDDGKQLYAIIGYFTTRQEGLQKLADFNDNPYDIVMSKTTFSEIYNRWCNDTFSNETNRSTKKNYESAYKLCTDLHDMKMSDIRPHHLQKVLDSFSDNYSKAQRINILFKQMYKWCIQHDCIKKNYANHLVVTAKVETKPRNPFSSDEIRMLWGNIEKNQYVKLVLMLIYSGVRISELLELKKEDVHLDEQWFKVRASKTNAGIRIVPIADKVLPFWKMFIEKSTCEYAVCTTDGQHLSYENFSKRYWRPLMEQFNLKHTIHETRHTFISQMVMKNVNQTILKKIVGHKSIMSLTENVYTHIEVKELLNEVNKI